MKTITNDFKNEIIKLGREIDFKFFLHTNDKIITENNIFLMTEDNRDLVVEQFNEDEIDAVITSEDIYNVSIVRKGKLFSTIMQELDFEVTQDLRIGDTIDASFGLKVNGEYEYIDYGRFMIYSKEFNEDTKTYSYVAFDSMLLSMVEANDRSIIENVTIKTAIENIGSKVGLNVVITEDDINNLPNLNKVIATDTFKDLEIIYRDVLDSICQCLGVSMVSNKNILKIKTINRTPIDTIDEEFLKDRNVKFGKKYGPINSVVLSRSEDNDNIYRKDDQSIELNGLTEFKIKDNLIMLGNDREDYIDEIYNQLHGLEYYINDFSSIGITYLEPLDMFNVSIGDKVYPCLLLNDEIKVRQGLEEAIYTEQPEETTTDYTTSGKTDKEVSFIVDKQRGNINAKVSKGDVINQINLDESGAIIEAEKIDLRGYVTVTDLAGEGTTTINGSNITTGEISANRIKGGQLKVEGYSENQPYIIVGKDTATYPDGPYAVYMWDYGIAAFNYGINGVNTTPNISTATESGYAELKGNDINCTGEVNSINGICQGSLKKLKKDITIFDEKALNIIKSIDIYNYKYKKQKSDKKHIGFIIDKKYNYSKKITNEKNTGVDLYSFVSVCCKAIQEQQEEIEGLKKEIKSLKEGDK